MADKIEVIRRRMARTRQSLQQKLDALEDRTLGAVQKTTDAVVDVAETVGETVESAKEAVAETVEKTERFFDLSRHAKKHPWAVMGGAVAAGFAASVLLSRATQGTPAPPRRRDSDDHPRTERTPERREQPSWLSNVVQMFTPQLEGLKDLAIGASVAVLRDMALQAVPKEWSHELGDVFNGLTERLGGKPLPVEQEDKPTEQAPAASETRPRWEERQSELPEPKKKKTHGNGRHSESAQR
jgi:ElaB/YqjD/DUF883 family membrane-anchored ribosome-binding protein